MNDLWKSSKSTSLTLLVTSMAGILILAFAYHLHHYTEILSGVIGGLTIILGMVTAEWLRSTRDEAEATERRLRSIAVNFRSVVFNVEYLLTDPSAPLHQEKEIALRELFYELSQVARKTRWPQSNAKEIRRQALEVLTGLSAMIQDATENEHIWSVEKRFGLGLEAVHLLNNIVDGTKEAALQMEMSKKKRETEPRQGMSMQWLRQAERERHKNG